MTTVDSRQLAVESGQRSAAWMPSAAGICRTRRCGRTAAVITADGFYCDQCWFELETVREAEQEKREKVEAQELAKLLRRQERAEAFRRAMKLVYRWVWLPELIFVIAVWFYILVALAAEFLQWKGW